MTISLIQGVMRSPTNNSSPTVVTLDTTAISGNLLLWFMANDKNNSITIPTGFTQIYNTTNTSVTKAAAWKISDGTETNVSAVHALGFNKAWVGEFDNAAYDVEANNHTETAGRSLSTGTTPTTHANAGAGAATWCNDSAPGAVTFSWTNSYVSEDESLTQDAAGQPALVVAIKIGSIGSTEETTGSYTGGGTDQMSAGIVILEDTDPPAGGGGDLLLTNRSIANYSGMRQ